MTKGEYRVGINFNPDNNDMVSKIKRAAVVLIDLIDHIEDQNNLGEIIRLKSLAQTEVESATMWAVKAATKPRT